MSKDKEVKLTLKQKKFLKLYFEYGNGTKAALEAYNTDNASTAAAIAYENLRKLHDPIKTLMEQKGLSLGRLLEVLDDGLGATRVISAVNTDKQADGATTNFIDVADHAVRHKYLETAAKWLGVTKDSGSTVNVNFNKIVQQQKDEYKIE